MTRRSPSNFTCIIYHKTFYFVIVCKNIMYEDSHPELILAPAREAPYVRLGFGSRGLAPILRCASATRETPHDVEYFFQLVRSCSSCDSKENVTMNQTEQSNPNSVKTVDGLIYLGHIPSTSQCIGCNNYISPKLSGNQAVEGLCYLCNLIVSTQKLHAEKNSEYFILFIICIFSMIG